MLKESWWDKLFSSLDSAMRVDADEKFVVGALNNLHGLGQYGVELVSFNKKSGRIVLKHKSSQVLGTVGVTKVGD